VEGFSSKLATATYRLEVDIAELSIRETLLGGKILLEWSQPSLE
jgi:hypothetical protein